MLWWQWLGLSAVRGQLQRWSQPTKVLPEQLGSFTGELGALWRKLAGNISQSKDVLKISPVSTSSLLRIQLCNCWLYHDYQANTRWDNAFDNWRLSSRQNHMGTWETLEIIKEMSRLKNSDVLVCSMISVRVTAAGRQIFPIMLQSILQSKNWDLSIKSIHLCFHKRESERDQNRV